MNIKRSWLVLQLGCIVVLAGCGRVLDWGSSNFTQAKKITSSSVPCQHIKSLIVYDQFSTVAIFDALWLSDAVRTVYADLHSFKQGKNVELSNAFLRRQLEENKHFISFYLLTPYDLLLGDKNSPWSVMLEIDGNLYAPLEIKVIEMAPEYQAFFGKKLNRFKAVQMLKFNAKDVEEKPLVTDATTALRLYFRAVDREVILEWPLHNGKLVVGDRPCVLR